MWCRRILQGRWKNARQRWADTRKPVASAVHEVAVDNVGDIHCLERQLHIEGLACGSSLVWFETMAKASVAVAVTQEGVYHRAWVTALEPRRKEPPLENPSLRPD